MTATSTTPEINVLMVEDNAEHALNLRRLLSASANPKFAVDGVGTLGEALSKVNDEAYNVILLDLSLPDSVGLHSFEKVNEAAERIPIIVLSGTSEVSVALEALQKGAQDYLVKGYTDHHGLLRSIQYAIERKQAQLALEQACDELDARVRQRTSELSHANERLKREVEDRKRAEELTLESNQQLMAALEELRTVQRDLVRRERFQALAQMANGIAHEFNNVLTPIVGFAEHLLNHPAIRDSPEPVRRNLEKIRAAALAGSKAVGRVRDFARGQAGEMGSVPVGELVESVVMLTEPKWRDESLAAGTTISIAQLVDDVPDLHGDPAQLREALTHLIFNATNSIVRRGLIRVGAERRSDGVAVFVHHDGTSMTEAQRQQCLDPKATSSEGCHSGYAVIHAILARHQGRLEIESQQEKGTKVTLVLPAEAPANNVSVEAPIDRLPAKWPRLHVLVADDEPMIREVIRLYLAEDGHTVETADDGSDALEKFRNGRFDLVFTDRAMPQLSGDQLAREVKALRPTVPVVLLTGFGDLMNAEGEKPRGIDAVASKPFTMASLRKVLLDLGFR